MTALLTKVLREHPTGQKRAALEKGQPLSERVLTGGRQEIIGRTALRNFVNRCCDSIGLRRIRIHNLRHS